MREDEVLDFLYKYNSINILQDLLGYMFRRDWRLQELGSRAGDL